MADNAELDTKEAVCELESINPD